MKVIVSNLDRAFELANNHSCDAVVSVVEPEVILPIFRCSHFCIRMHDTEVITDGWAPNFEDVVDIFNFCKGRNSVLVHCLGGISRSAALGVGLLVSDGKTVAQAIAELLEYSPNMNPNKLILSFIDRHLKADGRFLAE